MLAAHAAGGAGRQSSGKAAAEPAAPVVPQEKARLAASLFGDGDLAEPARARRSPNKHVRSRDKFILEFTSWKPCWMAVWDAYTN